MSSPSNLYAEKIFSEHPIAFWALDDVSDYISLISESQRNVSGWTVSNGTAEADPLVLDEPFPQSVTSRISIVNPDVDNIKCVSPSIISLDDLDENLSNLCVGAYVYSESEFIQGFDIGYEYFDSSSGQKVEEVRFFPVNVANRWLFLSETFQPRLQNSSVRVLIRARYFLGDSQENYKFLINGITLGQWSEEFNATSLGAEPEDVESGIFDIPGVKAIRASSYGLQDLPGYYLVKNNSLGAKNSSIPMVFGGSNLTVIQPLENLPSLIVPGLGFLNEAGKYKDYTFEFWLRVSADTAQEKRIFGNLRGQDGLYVGGPFLSLKINKHVIKHYVGEWYRPMIVHIRYSSNSISLLVNGEQVGELYIDAKDLSFPEEISNSLNNDWLAFFSQEDVSPLEIDSVAIYGYKVPDQVAKRRFVYGQGVEFPENINNSYSGSSVFIDYPFAKYSKNYSYPSLGKWEQASHDNVFINGNALSFPNVAKPQVVFNNKSYSEWLDDLRDRWVADMGQNYEDGLDPYISLSPLEPDWLQTDGHIFIEDLSLSAAQPKSFYVVCQENQKTTQRQTVITIEDNVTQNYFEVAIDGDSIDYILSIDNERRMVTSKQRYFSGEKFVIGINIEKFSDYYGGDVAQFFGRLSSSNVYIGGRKNFTETFRGRIYEIGMCSKKNSAKIDSVFYFDGTAFSDDFIDGNDLGLLADAGTDISTFASFQFVYDGGTLGQYASSVLNGHISSYHLSMQNSLAGFDLAVGSSSSWEDYIPLSSFAKRVVDNRGDERLDLDFIQFNVNYPAPSKFVQEKTDGSWTYEELRAEYASPIQRKYTSLDNSLFTGYQNYDDLKNRAESTYKYDTAAAVVRTYVTFQLLESEANRPLSSYTNFKSVPKEGLVDILGTEWLDTAYEVVDGVIIYPPQSLPFEDLAIVTHIEMKSLNVKDTPVVLKSLEYASLSLSETQATPIGTRFGNDIFPYRKEGFYFNYKQRNPFSIYKKSTPYLYLTKNSGITIKGINDPTVNRGISVPINPSSAEDYKVIALQMSLRFDQDFFPYAPIKIFEIQSRNSYIRVYMEASHPSGKRARIYAINSRGQLENGIAFYLNGNLVREPHITIKEWAMLGIRFSNTQDFQNYSGAIRITGPITVNNISHYKSTNLQEVQDTIIRPWFKVKSIGPQTLDWSYWNTGPSIWNEVLIISSSSYYGVDPSDIYKIYTGTNKIIIDDEISSVFGDYLYKVYKEVSWRSTVSKPA
jgi:hypothetical protein